MSLVFRTLHRNENDELLNDEWFVVENTGPGVVSAQGFTLTVARGPNDRPRPIGTLDPGFVLKPNEQIRLVSGTPSKKAQGAPPDEKGMKNYHLFLRGPVLSQPGVIVRLALNQMEVARAAWKPDAKNGIAEG